MALNFAKLTGNVYVYQSLAEMEGQALSASRGSGVFS